MSEALFDPMTCMCRWRIKVLQKHTFPPAWPEVAQAWFDRDLDVKRIRARVFARQVFIRKNFLAKVIPIGRALSYRSMLYRQP